MFDDHAGRYMFPSGIAYSIEVLVRISLLYVSPVGHGIHKMRVAVVWHYYRPRISCPSLIGVIILHGNCGQLPICTGWHPSLDRGGGGAFPGILRFSAIQNGGEIAKHELWY